MATYDATKNFAKVTVSTGYDASATNIVLSGSEGAKLPQPSTDGEFNLVWWNNTDYGDPSDDPNKEIVRCTARSTDTLTVTRNQESSGASIKNIASKTYRMALTITAKVIDDITDSIGGSTTMSVNQSTHGFSVGDVLRSDGTDDSYTEAQADSAANAEVTGLVTEVTDSNNFVMTTSGPIAVAAAVPNETAGTVLFLDPSSAGALTTTEPSANGQVSKPVAIVVEANAEMIFINWRGLVIADPSVTRSAGIALVDSGSFVATGDGTQAIGIGQEFNGMEIINVIAVVHTKGVTATTDIVVRRRRAGADVDVLSTPVTIGDEWYAEDGVINTSNDDLATGDALYIDVDAVHSGTAPKGLTVMIQMQ